MLRQRRLQEKDDGGGLVSEENFLRYRLQIVQTMPDGPLKAAIATAIATRAEALRQSGRTSRTRYPPTLVLT
jgi:hypothetical protein